VTQKGSMVDSPFGDVSGIYAQNADGKALDVPNVCANSGYGVDRLHMVFKSGLDAREGSVGEDTPR
jgi:hypothetical protein